MSWRQRALISPFRFFLSLPLSLKLTGSHLILTAPGLFILFRASAALPRTVLVVTTVLWVALIPVSWILAYLALRPLSALDASLARAARGEYSVRVPQSLMEDRSFSELRAQVNTLLEVVDDDLLSAHTALATLSRVSTLERVRLQEVLHESLAQILFAISCRASAIEAGVATASPGDLMDSIEELRALAQAASSDLASLARGLGDLPELPGSTAGLSAAVGRDRSLAPPCS